MGLAIGVLVAALTAKQMYIPLTSSYWIQYPTETNKTGIMGKDTVTELPLGLPVAISFFISAIVNGLVFAGQIDNHRDSTSGKSWATSIARSIDDFAIYVATYVDLSLIAGLTDVVHIIFVIALVACASTLTTIASDQLLHMPTCGRGAKYNPIHAVKNTAKYLMPMIAATFFTIVPWIGIVWYYARSHNQSARVTALIIVSAIITVIWRVVNVVEHVYAERKWVLVDVLIMLFMFASSVGLGLATFLFFLYI